jgi:16S rRNA (cytidine1402-2'-O)-methyltransferase
MSRFSENNGNCAPGKLLVVATPIGNLGDLSARMLAALKSVDRVAAEDTRVTRKLLQAADSKARCFSHHRFNEQHGVETCLKHLLAGESLALVSDAGTPGISDPGYRLVDAALGAGIEVVSVPGPSAVAAACSLCGFDCTRFTFTGFLPRKRPELARLLESLAGLPGTWVFFETPHRLEKSLSQFASFFPPETKICLCKEMTKKFEKVIRAPLSEIPARLASTDRVRGEWTGIVQLPADAPVFAGPESERNLREVCDFFRVDRKRGLKILAAATGRSKNELYARHLKS